MSFDPGNRLIVALDVPSADEALALADRLEGSASWLKVGLELYTEAGPDIVRALVAKGARIMLDLKLHDIPATVGRATARVASLGAELLTVHTCGGPAMLKAAAEAAGDMGILGVTVLTSMDESDLAAVGAAGTVDELVARRARLAIDSGCAGVVSSPNEAARIRAMAPEGFLIVTPGVRPAGSEVGDQKRVATPAAARAHGADLVVVGRPVRYADDPAAMASLIARELM